jgi:hypothetical protein
MRERRHDEDFLLEFLEFLHLSQLRSKTIRSICLSLSLQWIAAVPSPEDLHRRSFEAP